MYLQSKSERTRAKANRKVCLLAYLNKWQLSLAWQLSVSFGQGCLAQVEDPIDWLCFKEVKALRNSSQISSTEWLADRFRCTSSTQKSSL